MTSKRDQMKHGRTVKMKNFKEILVIEEEAVNEKAHKMKTEKNKKSNTPRIPPRWNSPCRGEGAYSLSNSNQCINK